MPRPIAAPAPRPPACAVVGIAVSDTAASAPATTTHRPSLPIRAIIAGPVLDWVSLRVCICLDMALSNLSDRTLSSADRNPDRPDVVRPTAQRHLGDPAANFARQPATELAHQPAARRAQVSDTFTFHPPKVG